MLFLVTMATFSRLKLSRGTIIAANIGQIMDEETKKRNMTNTESNRM